MLRAATAYLVAAVTCGLAIATGGASPARAAEPSAGLLATPWLTLHAGSRVRLVGVAGAATGGVNGGIEIVYFGLLVNFIGKGLGGAMLSRALQHAWALGPERVWVHTCTLDHPAALANYEARGMRIYRTGTETVSGND